jgi:16S rRNA (guanine527-N7)-methyltransferase
MKIRQKPAERVWAEFQDQEKISDELCESFKRYEILLSQRNKEINLTAVKELSGIVRYHFQDSLAIRKFIDLSTVKTICDIGTGAGFPAIPVKILYPHLKVILIEVTKKKQDFLEDLVEVLSLENIDLYTYDWRTFLRHSQYDLDLFVTRAAIDEKELVRAFKPSCRYNKSTVVYWVTKDWEPCVSSQNLVKRVENYRVGNKERKLAFLSL